MNIAEIIDSVTAGGFVAVVVIVLGLVEITPIKVSPLAWIGKRLNKETLERVGRIEEKFDEHNAQSYRDKILAFQNRSLRNLQFTMEEWNEVIDACDAYEQYVKDNNLKNGKAELAIAYIKKQYTKCLNTNNFITLN